MPLANGENPGPKVCANHIMDPITETGLEHTFEPGYCNDGAYSVINKGNKYPLIGKSRVSDQEKKTPK